MRRHELTDQSGNVFGRSSADDPVRVRDVVTVISSMPVIWRVKTGVQWRDLAERYGSWKTVHNRFHRWARTGRWESIFKALRLDVDDVGSLVNASVVRAHQDAAGGKGGSEEMLWGVLEEVFQQKFTPSQRRAVSRSTSKSRQDNSTRRR